ncbi:MULTISPECIES: AlkA N-terminal domain-containing protein [unclassified Brevibacterium]|uniref:AlkA N-terminal domain-containing protein n=1 Tax=unclassified Brevibacterium TaxID=2614124 RepID=UPI0010922BBD|nr:AlkA N-terminal domain-containing protein [Brevibacterium sp. S22]TGD31270.1 DNA-3-methyladenine glycosylase 2 family protein [Brevibacterium sp. S22]
MFTSDQCYQAVTSRDRRFDGMFFTAVRTTGIFCRPSCPAKTPHRANVDFFITAAAAADAGFRACRRCRPDASPNSPQWDTRGDIVARAVRLIRDGAVDRGGVASVAAALGYSSRQLGRLFHAEVGAGPLALARTERVRTARTLIEATSMPMSEIAFAAGFSSIRQFNETFRDMYSISPRQLRTAGAEHPVTDELVLRLAYRPPFDFAHLLKYFEMRAVAGIESISDGAYTRSMRLAHGPAVITLRQGAGDFIACRLRLADTRDLGSAVARARRTLDLDADPVAIAETLRSAGLRSVVDELPGIRSPGHSDPVELALRTVLGQQISLSAARTHLERLVAGTGEALSTEMIVDGVDRLFPTAECIAAVPAEKWSLPASRIRTIQSLSTAMADGRLDLGPGSDRDAASMNLLALPGIGPWSNGYIRMRALGDPDVFMGSDLGVKKAVAELGGNSVSTGDWSETVRKSSPWRSYLTHLLWAHHAHAART